MHSPDIGRIAVRTPPGDIKVSRHGQLRVQDTSQRSAALTGITFIFEQESL